MKLRELLTHREGIWTEHVNVASILGPIYDVRVPSGRIMSPDSGRPFKLELWTKIENVAILDGTGAAGPGGTEEDYIAYATIVAGAGGAPLLPYKASGTRYVLTEEVRIVHEGGGTGTVGDVVTLTANSDVAVGYGVADTEGVDYDVGDLVTVYYRPTVAGLFVLEYAKPDMLGQAGRSILSIDTVTMMLNNPFHRDQFIPFRAPTVWPSQWLLRMKLRAPWLISFVDALPTPDVALPEWHIPMIVESVNDYDSGIVGRVTDSLIQY